MLLGAGLLDDDGKTLRAFTDKSQSVKAVIDLREGRWTSLKYNDPFDFSGAKLDEQHLAVLDYEEHDNYESAKARTGQEERQNDALDI
jgi:type VI secretion system secreted protein VgrG